MNHYPFFYLGHGLCARINNFSFYCWFAQSPSAQEKMIIESLLYNWNAVFRFMNFSWCRNILHITDYGNSNLLNQLIEQWINCPQKVIEEYCRQQPAYADRTIDIREVPPDIIKLLCFNYLLDKLLVKLQEAFPLWLCIYEQSPVTKFSPWHYHSLQHISSILDHIHNYFQQNEDEKNCRQPVQALNKILNYLVNDMLFKTMTTKEKEMIYETTLVDLGYNYDINKKYLNLLNKLNNRDQNRIIIPEDPM